jgi:two-component system sensor histidine kinase CreC
MPLGVRIFLVYFLFVGLAGWFVLSTVMDEIRPGVRQSTEETLVDTANLLAELLSADLRAGRLQQSSWQSLFQAYGQRQPQAQIGEVSKLAVNHRIYVTDAAGKVLLDSSGQAVGEDYSRWNDVYLTLRGEYGARSSREVADDPESSVMYVAAPIKDQGRIIGVVAVSKPSRTLQPYIERSQQRLARFGAGLIGLGLLLGALLSWWLSAALRRLTGYARAVSAGQRVSAPALRGGELGQLATALEQMRRELEGKAYVERYVHTLTHELKSPLAAIRGAAELLEGEMAEAPRQRFVANIQSESARLQQLIERLLHLAQVEQRQGLEERVAIPLHGLLGDLSQAQAARIQAAGVQVENQVDAGLQLLGERFLLRQALSNLLDNALDFTPPGGVLRWSTRGEDGQLWVCLYNSGPAIPDYALARLTERFYSLPRPTTGRKSTGLGLNFVQEVVNLHGGALRVGNVPGGVEVGLRLPTLA